MGSRNVHPPQCLQWTRSSRNNSRHDLVTADSREDTLLAAQNQCSNDGFFRALGTEDLGTGGWKFITRSSGQV
ncbi:hypothetical protein TNCV_1749751 [Trichonephila clavipes]|nr:hypothetical protein TNCV_1749751 [Trichonephila clavipes]